MNNFTAVKNMGHRVEHQATRHNPKRVVSVPAGREEAPPPRLEIVLKCGTDGSRAALEKALREKSPERLEVAIIHSGVGDITKNDVLLAATASRLIVGFEVGVNPHLDGELQKSGVEVRLYQVIYRLVEDLSALERSLVAEPDTEQILGQALIVALFKGNRHGVILGCEVRAGRLAVGERFRLIGAMGPLYEGRIESLHIEKEEVRAAVPPQRVGLKISDFQHAAVGDLLESYRPAAAPPPSWRAKPGVFPR